MRPLPSAAMSLISFVLLSCIGTVANADRAGVEIQEPAGEPTLEELLKRRAPERKKSIERLKKLLNELERINAEHRGKRPEVDARNDAAIKRGRAHLEKRELELAKQKRKQQTDWHLRGLPGER